MNILMSNTLHTGSLVSGHRCPFHSLGVWHVEKQIFYHICKSLAFSVSTIYNKFPFCMLEQLRTLEVIPSMYWLKYQWQS